MVVSNRIRPELRLFFSVSLADLTAVLAVFVVVVVAVVEHFKTKRTSEKRTSAVV